jgi:hypothetical protein
VANHYNNWAEALTLAKDTANMSSVYADMLANPDKQSDIVLAVGGVVATRANKADDALKLFELSVKKNPNSRDGLRNVAASYYGKDRFKEMWAPSAKLVALDPNNYDGWMMFAYASQGLAKAAKLPAEKKAWTDSLVKYQTFAENLPVKVDVSGFSRGANEATLILALELFVRKTVWGQAVHAVSLDPELALVQGIPVRLLVLGSFMLSSALAGVAGVLIAQIGGTVDPAFGFDLVLLGFVAAVLGGMGSSMGALAGGLLVGILSKLVGGYVSTAAEHGIAFALLMLALALRPQGLFGRPEVSKA